MTVCIEIPTDIDVCARLIVPCPALPKPLRPLLRAMLAFAQRWRPRALACSVSTAEGGLYARLAGGSVPETIASFNVYVGRVLPAEPFKLVVHGGAVEAPPDSLASNHVRLVRDPAEPHATVWVLPAGSVAADAVVAAAQATDRCSRLIETGEVLVTILDVAEVLALAS